jgi:hypothetical protein
MIPSGTADIATADFAHKAVYFFDEFLSAGGVGNIKRIGLFSVTLFDDQPHLVRVDRIARSIDMFAKDRRYHVSYRIPLVFVHQLPQFGERTPRLGTYSQVSPFRVVTTILKNTSTD